MPPFIPLRTAQSDPTSPRDSSPGISPDAFGYSKGQALARAGSQFTQDFTEAVSNVAGFVASEIKEDQKIKAAKDDALLRESKNLTVVKLKGAAQDALTAVPSDADLGPGEPAKKTLEEDFGERALKIGEELRKTVPPHLMDQFNAHFDLEMEKAKIKIRQVQRNRDIDASRASLERSEGLYLERAADPSEDPEALLKQWHDDVNASVASGAYRQEQGEELKRKTGADIQKVHRKAVFKEAVDVSTEYFTGLDLPGHMRIELTKDLPDGIREEVQKRVRAFNKNEEFDRQQIEEEQFDAAALDIEFNGKSPEDVGVENFSPKYQRELRQLHRRVASPKTGGSRGPTDEQVQAGEEAWKMRDENPEEFKRFNFRKHVLDYPPRVYRELVAEQKELRDGKSADDPPKPKARKMAAAKELIRAAYPKDTAKQGWAMYRLQELADNRYPDPEKVLTPKEERELAAEAIRPLMTTDRGLFFRWGGPKRPIDLTPEMAVQIVQRPAADQDPEWRDYAVKRLMAEGKKQSQITAEDIEMTIFNFMIELGHLDDEGKPVKSALEYD